MEISIIVAYGKNREIGLDNKLLWHISEDLKNFKALTNGHHILMGRKTFDSIGKPLPNRTSIVLSKNGFEFEGVHSFSELEKAISFAKDSGEDELFIIGGEQIYNLVLPFATKLYLSLVDYDGEADAYFSEIDFCNWQEINSKKYEAILEDGKIKTLAWEFKELKRK